MRFIISTVCCCVVLASGVNAADVPWGEVTIRMVKSRFMEGEPIGMRITFSNRTNRELGLEDPYPFYGLFSESGAFRLTVTSRGKARKVTLPTFSGEGLSGLRRIAAKRDSATTIYLQRFIGQPGAGKYEVACELKLPFFEMESDYPVSIPSKKHQVQSAKCKLSFTIEPTDSKKLDALYADLATKVRSGSYDSSRESAEALCVVEDPAVVPYLFVVLNHGWRRDDALDAVERASRGKAPYYALSDLLAQKDPTRVCKVLGIMAGAKYEIGPTWARKLLADERGAVRKAARQYVLALNDENYLRLLTGR